MVDTLPRVRPARLLITLHAVIASLLNGLAIPEALLPGEERPWSGEGPGEAMNDDQLSRHWEPGV